MKLIIIGIIVTLAGVVTMLVMSKPYIKQCPTEGVIVGNDHWGDVKYHIVEYYVHGIKYEQHITHSPFKKLGDKIKIQYQINDPSKVMNSSDFVLGWIIFGGAVLLGAIVIIMGVNGKKT